MTIFNCPFCGSPARNLGTISDCPLCNRAWETVYGDKLREKYKTMDTRTCPQCGEVCYSADTSADRKVVPMYPAWPPAELPEREYGLHHVGLPHQAAHECGKCGGNIPLNRMTSPGEEDFQKREEEQPPIRWLFKKKWECDWEYKPISLIKWFLERLKT